MSDESKPEHHNEKKENPYIIHHSTGSGKTLASKYIIESVLDLYRPTSFVSEIIGLFSSSEKEKKKTIEQQKSELVKELMESDIDPVAFDVLLSNETNRRLKVQFGIAFLVMTLLFTIASYSIVVLDGIYKWGISEVAITALIIETPIQFVGLLYIIARNLFPNTQVGSALTISTNSDDQKQT